MDSQYNSLTEYFRKNPVNWDILTVLLLIFSIVSTAGNAFVIYKLARNFKRKSPLDLVAMTVAFGMMLLSWSSLIPSLEELSLSNNLLCTLKYNLGQFSASLILVALMALIVLIRFRPDVELVLGVAATICIWTLTIILVVPLHQSADFERLGAGHFWCRRSHEENSNSSIAKVFQFLVRYVLPIILPLILLIVLAVLKVLKRRSSVVRHQYLWIYGLTVLTYFCVARFAFLSLQNNLKSDDESKPSFYFIAWYLLYIIFTAVAAFNPFIYFYCKSNFIGDIPMEVSYRNNEELDRALSVHNKNLSTA